MFERQIVDANDHRTRSDRRRRELDVQDINRIASQFAGERERDTD
jgi:hypothetical protein